VKTVFFVVATVATIPNGSEGAGPMEFVADWGGT
jgi:hypothetical protein